MPELPKLLAVLVEHIDICETCQRANKRVNDFCDLGRLMFAEYAKTAKPYKTEEVTVTQEQYDRLVAENARARKSAKDN